MQLTDKDLRHGAHAAGALHHHRPLARLVVELDVADRYAFALEQVAGPLAIPAPVGGVHDHFGCASARLLDHPCLPSLRAAPFTSGRLSWRQLCSPPRSVTTLLKP